VLCLSREDEPLESTTCQNIGRLRWGNHPCSSACAGSGLRFLHLSTSTCSNSSQFCARKDSPSVSTSWQSSMQAPSECPRSCCPVSLARTHMRDALCALQKHVCQVGMPVAHASLNRSSPCRLQLSARVRGGLHFSRLAAAGRMQLPSLVWGAPRDGESSRGAGTGQSCRFILHWCKSELRGTQASFHVCPLTRRERRRAQRLRAIETRDASLTDVSALKALEQREKAALAAMLTLKAQTEYQDNSHSSLHERDLLKTGGRGDNARAHKRCHVCSSHNLELTLCREMGILAPVSRYRLPHSSAAHSGRINRAHRERIVDIAVRRGLFRNYAQPRLPVLLRFCTCHACRRKRVRHKLRHKLRRQHRKRGDLPGARAARAIRMCMSSCLFMYF